MPDPVVELTHAVTIDASPEQVWPWLVQLGHGRAGFYSDSRFWDRSVDWYDRVLSRERTGKPASRRSPPRHLRRGQRWLSAERAGAGEDPGRAAHAAAVRAVALPGVCRADRAVLG